MTKQRDNSSSSQLALLATLLAGTAILAGSCHESGTRRAGTPPTSQTNRPVEREWAERIDLPGLPNLHKVSDDLYRGAQPSADGMKQLEKLGVKTIVNLRFITSDRKLLKGTGLEYEHINTTTLSTDTADVIRFLKIVTDAKHTPVFVHCHRGIERTGLMCAAYRIVVEGWTKDEAIREMTQGGFATDTIRKNLVNYIRKMDVEKIKHATSVNK